MKADTEISDVSPAPDAIGRERIRLEDKERNNGKSRRRNLPGTVRGLAKGLSKGCLQGIL